MDDVAKPLKDKDGCDEVGHFELLECLDARSHELLSLLLRAGGEIFKHLKEELLSLVNPLGALDH